MHLIINYTMSNPFNLQRIIQIWHNRHVLGTGRRSIRLVHRPDPQTSHIEHRPAGLCRRTPSVIANALFLVNIGQVPHRSLLCIRLFRHVVFKLMLVNCRRYGAGKRRFNCFEVISERIATVD